MRLKVEDLTILLVEPSFTQQKIIMNILRNAGVETVTCASNGQLALSTISQSPPDLVISCMYLEDMTATELLNEIRQSEHISDVPFMLVSSEERFGKLDPIKQAGVIAVLPKPFTVEALNCALKNTLNFIDPDRLELESYDPSDLRVLLVDDSPLARKFIRRTLEDMGIENIVEAEDGSRAIERLQTDHNFDLIVSDYNMPEMDGKELVKAIKANEVLNHIPVLMVTSEKNRAVLNNIEQVGVSAICDKPFESGNVKQLLASILD